MATGVKPVPADEELVFSAQGGDVSAQEELVQRYWQQVHRWSRRYFLPGAEPDDLWQEALLGFLKAVRDYTPGASSFGGFAYLCVRRHLISVVKGCNRYKHQPLNHYVPLHVPITDVDGERPLIETLPQSLSSDPESLAILRDQLHRVQDIIAHSLSPFELDVLSLYINGLSYHEMAEKLKTHAKSIDNALCRIKQKMHQVTC
ncbi:MAG: sigma-70 family RNA polymerase sigma factor [Limnochordaceae bacterium]|nr:sigma-70 family RNA polymerase sigma factor [Limnochordaceae bacterium]